MSIIVDNDTKLIKTATLEYPVTYREVKKRYLNTIFPLELTSTRIKHFGFEYVHPTPKPLSGNSFYEEDKPELVKGEYYQRWKKIELDPEKEKQMLDDYKEQCVLEVRKNLVKALEKGFRWYHGQSYDHIQLRDGDRANLTGLRVDIEDRIKRGDTEPEYFRTYEDNILVLTPQQAVDLTRMALVMYKKFLGLSWVLVDTINKAPNLESIPRDLSVDIYSVPGLV